MILFAMTTGKLPFDDDNIRRLLAKVKNGVFTIPKFLNPEVADLIQRMLVADPVRRISIKEIKEHTEAGNKPRFLIIDMVAVENIDATGVRWLENFLHELNRDYEITVVIANPNKGLLLDLKRADLIEQIGEDNIHVNLRSAVHWAQLRLEKFKSNEDLNSSGAGKDTGGDASPKANSQN